MTLAVIGFVVSMSIYLHRLEGSDLNWKLLLLFTVYEGLYIIPAGGMLIYHTQLSVVNLTTNEHQNLYKYDYLKKHNGRYQNPYFRGLWSNFWDRMNPSVNTYELPSAAEDGQTTMMMDPLLEVNDPVANMLAGDNVV